MHDRPVESTTSIPTRLGRLHVRTIGDGAPTVLWSSMFVDSHTWDPLVPLLPTGRRYVLVDPPGLGLSEPLRRAERHPGRRRRGHRPARTGSASTARSTGSATPSAGTSASSSARDPACSAAWWPSAHRPSRSPPRCAGRSTSCCPSCGPRARSAPCARRSSGPCSPTPPPPTPRLRGSSWSPWRARPGAAWPWPSGPSSSTGSTSTPSSRTSPYRACSWPPTTAGTGVPRTPRRPPPSHPTPSCVTVQGARTLVPLEQPQALAAHIRRFWDRLA